MAPRIYAHPWDHQKRDIVDTKTHASRKMGQCGGKKPGSPLLWGKEKQNAREKEERQPFLKRSFNLFYSGRIVSLWHFFLDMLLFLETMARSSEPCLLLTSGGPTWRALVSKWGGRGEEGRSMSPLHSHLWPHFWEVRWGEGKGEEERKNKRVRGGKENIEKRECVCVIWNKKKKMSCTYKW